MADFKFILQMGKRRFRLRKSKDASLTIKFKIALGTKRMCQLWKRVVLCAATGFHFLITFLEVVKCEW